MSNNKITQQGFLFLHQDFSLDCFLKLTSLNLSKNNITDDGFLNFLSLIEMFPMLVNLYLENCNLSYESMRYLCEYGGSDAASNHNKLKQKFLNKIQIIDLSDNKIGDFGFSIMLSCDDLQNLQYLYIRRNKLTNEVTTYPIFEKESIVEIDFSSNSMSKQIIRYIKKNDSTGNNFVYNK